MRRLLLGCSAALLLASYLPAQSFSTAPCSGDEGNAHSSGWLSQAHACELRRTMLPVVNGQVDVSGTNGGIEIIGQDRGNIAWRRASSRRHPARERHANCCTR